MAVDNGGQIYTSTDSGANWTPRESSRSWNSVASSSDGTKLVAVVRFGQIYTSTDSGASWTARESNRFWTSVASSSDGTRLVAVAYGGQIYTLNQNLSGAQGDMATLQYVGNGQWTGLAQTQVAAGAVGTPQLAAGAVSAANITAGAVGTTQLAAGAVGTSQLATNAVGVPQLAPAVASGLWTASGADVYRSGGSVGIGTSTPAKTLNVALSAGPVPLGTGNPLASLGLLLTNTDTTGTVASPNVVGIGFGRTITQQAIVGGSFGNDGLDFYIGGNFTTPKVRIDAGGKVGIGTFTPASTLDVAGTANVSGNTTVGGNLFVTGPGARFGLNTTGFSNVTATLQARATDAATLDVLNAAGTQVFLLDTVGNTTIGGTAAVLGNTITNGSSTIGGSLAVGTTAVAPIARIDVFGDGWFRGASGSLPTSASKGVRVFHDTTLGLGSIYAYDYANNVPLNLELQQRGGRVGIGTSMPAATLDVTGTVHISANATVDGTLVTGGASVTTLGVSGNASIAGSLTAGGTSAGITLNGRTGIGVAPNNDALKIQRFSSSEFNTNFLREDGQAFVQIGTPSGAALLVNKASGLITRTDNSSSWDVLSDLRLKHDVQAVTGALATLARLRPVRYHYNADFLAKMQRAPDIEHFGVVAQEFQQVFPDFVDVGTDGILSVRMDPIPIVTAAAVQELDAKVKGMATENAALKEQVSQLEARLRALEAKIGTAQP